MNDSDRIKRIKIAKVEDSIVIELSPYLLEYDPIPENTSLDHYDKDDPELAIHYVSFSLSEAQYVAHKILEILDE